MTHTPTYRDAPGATHTFTTLPLSAPDRRPDDPDRGRAMSDLETYLAGLKAGDVVIVHSRVDGYRERSVDKVTKTQIIVGGAKFRRSDGYEMGPEWGRESNIEYPTKKVRHIATFRAVRDALRYDLTLDTIPAMRAALDRAEAALREGEQ